MDMRCTYRAGVVTLVVWTLAVPAMAQSVPGAAAASAGGRSARPDAVTQELRVDPLTLVSLEEAWRVADHLREEVFPAWDMRRTPVLIYRPGVQDVLINHAAPPPGFRRWDGDLLPGADVFIRDDSTFLDVDDQNTFRTIEGHRTLIVADPASRLRSQLAHTLTDRSREWAERWLDEWGFLEPPYQDLLFLLHEGFHVYQAEATEKAMSMAAGARYPALDPDNRALLALEGRILKAAILAQTPTDRLERARQFVAVREDRRRRLDPVLVEYEDGTEFFEGLASYVEYAFLGHASGLTPHPTMRYHRGFPGYGSALRERFAEKLERMVAATAADDDRFGAGRYGLGPVRAAFYETGAAQGVLLDSLGAAWTERIFEPGTSFTDLVRETVTAEGAEFAALLEAAAREHDYAELRDRAVAFQREAREWMAAEVDAILHPEGTRVTIDYSGYKRFALRGFNPFGVTTVDAGTQIMRQPYFHAQFAEGIELHVRVPIPVLLQTERKKISFAVDLPGEAIALGSDGRIELDEFTLVAPGATIERDEEGVTIRLGPSAWRTTAR
jgi:hypothetical protein